MNDSVYEELTRLSLKRELSSDERLRIDMVLAAHPELRERWESDVGLGRMLANLPEVPVSSNFTSVVMNAIELEERQSVRDDLRRKKTWFPSLGRRLSWACALALLLGFSIYQHRGHDRRTHMARGIRVMSTELASLPPSLPGPEIFQDFDAIDRLRQVPLASDDRLLEVLQQ